MVGLAEHQRVSHFVALQRPTFSTVGLRVVYRVLANERLRLRTNMGHNNFFIGLLVLICFGCDGSDVAQSFRYGLPGGMQTYFSDLDGDGLGNPDEFVARCESPQGYVTNSDDVAPDCAANVFDDCGRLVAMGHGFFADQDNVGW